MANKDLEDEQQVYTFLLLPFTLKVPISTAADDNFCNIFPSFRGMIYNEDSHKIS